MDLLQRAPENQATPLVGYNVATSDTALMQAVNAFGGADTDEIVEAISPLGRLSGSAETRGLDLAGIVTRTTPHLES